MKKLITCGFLAIGVLLFSNVNANAQSNFKVGGGLAYGSEVEAVGIQLGGKYAFTEQLSGVADLAIFFPENYDWWALNLNANYHFLQEDNISVYGLGGLNYATLKVDMGQFGSASTSEVGLNLGGGAEFGLDFANLYTELKYVIGEADQLALTAGLRFDI